MNLKSLERFSKKFSNPKNIEVVIMSAASEHEAEIIALNHLQLREGKLSNSENTQEYASASYLNYKSSKGSKSLPYADLFDGGKFYKGWDIDYKSTEAIFNSKDSKRDDLVFKYGIELFGLTQTSKGVASRIVAPTFVNKMRNESKR